MLGFMYDPKAIWLALIIVAILGTTSRIYVYNHVNRIVRELHDAVAYFTAEMPKLLTLAAKADSATEAVETLEGAIRQLSTVLTDRLEAVERKTSRHLRAVPDELEDEGVS